VGIRVHKVLGYGLTDVKTRKWKIADGRINSKSPLFDYDTEATFDNYIDWLKEKYSTDESRTASFNMDMWYVREREEEGFDWYKKTGAFTFCDLIHRGENTMKNVLLIRPLAASDWSRYDDPIDWIEETYDREDGQSNWYKTLSDGIFPYSGTYMNAHTGEGVKDGMELHRCFTWEGWDKLYNVDALVKACGFADVDDARQNLVPKVPASIRDLCEWGKLFTRDDVWRQLRPMLYTYWS
jgi:hypothetical protein